MGGEREGGCAHAAALHVECDELHRAHAAGADRIVEGAETAAVIFEGGARAPQPQPLPCSGSQQRDSQGQSQQAQG